MAEFKITGPDGKTYRVTGENAEGALGALQSHLGQLQEFDTSTVAGKIAKRKAEGRDPTVMGGTKEEQVRRAVEAAPSTTAGVATNFLQGLPFVGEYADEALGAASDAITGQDYGTDLARAERARFAQDNPNTALGLNLAGGVAGAVPLAMAAAPAVAASAPSSLAGRAMMGGAAGLVGGGVEGAISGYGAGDGGDRMRSAQERGMLGAGLGAAVGAAAPAVASGVSKVAQSLMDATSARRLAAQGLRPETTRVLNRAIEAEGPGNVMARLQAAGPDAMLADGGEALAQQLDTAANASLGGGRIAREAVEGRAGATAGRLTQALDDTLGAPQGIRQTARDIASNTRAGRASAYDAAYSAPIDYASNSGRNIEGVLQRIPPRTLKAAVQDANEDMISRGLSNQQIMADIADDGTVTFREMPNVQQLDSIKQALDRQVTQDAFGRTTAEGLRPQRLARELRDALSDAVPEYRAALDAGADKIGQDKALQMGQRVLSKGTTREDVADAMRNATASERQAAKAGLRMRIDDEMANVRRIASDPNIDAREASKGLAELSSRASREKVAEVLGAGEADKLFAQIDEMGKALELKARVARNSATAVRQATRGEIDRMAEPGPVGKLMQGQPLEAGRDVIRALTGNTQERQLARSDAMMADLARALTERRGPAAQAQMQEIINALLQAPQNQARAGAIGRAVGAGGALGGYQLGQQSLGR